MFSISRRERSSAYMLSQRGNDSLVLNQLDMDIWVINNGFKRNNWMCYPVLSDSGVAFKSEFFIFSKIIVVHLRSLFLAGKGRTAASPCFFSAPSSSRPYMDRADCRNRDSLFSCRNMEYAYLVFSRNMISVQLQEHGTCLHIIFSRNMISVQPKEHGTCIFSLQQEHDMSTTEGHGTGVWIVYSRNMISVLMQEPKTCIW